MRRVTDVRALPLFRIWVRFEDGVEGEVDLSDMAGIDVFAQWETPGVFERVFVDPETWTVAWPGGLDLAPDALYVDVVNPPITA